MSVSVAGAVSVAPVQREIAASRFNANGMTFAVDLNEFSRQLAGLVSESLERAGAAVGPGGKRLEIEVVYLDFMFEGPCYVDYTVELGNGERFGQQALGESGNFTTACTRALEVAVRKIVADERTKSYLGGL